VTPDAGVIAATALLTMGIGLAIGVVAAWQSVAALRVDEGLRPGRRWSLGPFGRGLLVAQVALTTSAARRRGLFHDDAGSLASERYVPSVAAHRLRPRIS
jgi:hypothetical protein